MGWWREGRPRHSGLGEPGASEVPGGPLGLHLVPAEEPDIFTVLGVEETLLDPHEFEREPGPDFLEPRLGPGREDMAMVADKDKVALVVDGDEVSTREFGVGGREESLEQAGRHAAQTRGEVAREQFWKVWSIFGMVGNGLVGNVRGEPEER